MENNIDCSIIKIVLLLLLSENNTGYSSATIIISKNFLAYTNQAFKKLLKGKKRLLLCAI